MYEYSLHHWFETAITSDCSNEMTFKGQKTKHEIWLQQFPSIFEQLYFLHLQITIYE